VILVSRQISTKKPQVKTCGGLFWFSGVELSQYQPQARRPGKVIPGSGAGEKVLTA
jgi:hypothetical protein